MKKFGILPRIAVGLGALAALVAAGSAQAATTTTCTAPTVYQPFIPWGDSNYYVLAPGEGNDYFAATGWTLSNGAKTVTTSLYDGTSGPVLDLPSGSKAVSPQICVNNLYPYLRTLVQDTNSGSIAVYMSYLQSNGSWSTAKSVGAAKGPAPAAWGLSNLVMLPTNSLSGWEMARLTLTAIGSSTDNRLYNLYVDPRMKK